MPSSLGVVELVLAKVTGASYMDANAQAALPSLPASPRDAEDAFVINLCSSTTPMALTKPKDPALEQFKFFVSRRREDGRERFRMHMGYFPSLAAAEEWLPVVREVYPSAWAGEAPGRKLKNAAPVEASAPPLPKPAAEVPVQAAPVPPQNVPTLQAAPPLAVVAPAKPVAAPVATVPPARVVEPAPIARKTEVAPEVRKADVPAVARTVAAPPAASKPVTVPAPAKPAPAPQPAAAANKPAAAKPATPTPAAPPPQKQSNIREVIAQLDELSDTGTLRVLEGRAANQTADAADEVIKLVKPDDTQTMRAIKADVQRKAPVYFAVQLEWSVQPIDMKKVPPLAIFNAYTLYTTEGNKDGRRWYGLRLGFFSDAISAKQVAYYVRSDFAAVAVVPVSSMERERANGGNAAQTTARAANGAAEAGSSVAPIMTAPPPSARKSGSESGIFKLLEDDTPKPIELDVIGETSPRKAKPASDAAPKTGSNGGTTKSRAGTRLPAQQAKAKASPKKLDETLEILGADDLEFDAGKGELVTGADSTRHLRDDKRTSKFSSLLDRIASKLGRS